MASTTTMPSADTNDLIDRVHALPRELFDYIEELVFTPDVPSTAIADITPAYKPPAMLQINRATREQFAEAFFRNTTFRVFHHGTPDRLFPEHLALFIKWLKSLPHPHRLSIRKVHLERDLQRAPRKLLSPASRFNPVSMFGNALIKALTASGRKISPDYPLVLAPRARVSTNVLLYSPKEGTRMERVTWEFGNLEGFDRGSQLGMFGVHLPARIRAT